MDFGNYSAVEFQNEQITNALQVFEKLTSEMQPMRKVIDVLHTENAHWRYNMGKLQKEKQKADIFGRISSAYGKITVPLPIEKNRLP